MRCRSRARLGAIWRTSLIESWGAEQQVIQRWVTTNALVSSYRACIVGDAALASGPAWLLRGHAPDRATPRNPRPEPTLPSGLRIDSNVPASPHRADLSL